MQRGGSSELLVSERTEAGDQFRRTGGLVEVPTVELIGHRGDDAVERCCISPGEQQGNEFAWEMRAAHESVMPVSARRLRPAALEHDADEMR